VEKNRTEKEVCKSRRRKVRVQFDPLKNNEFLGGNVFEKTEPLRKGEGKKKKKELEFRPRLDGACGMRCRK